MASQATSLGRLRPLERTGHEDDLFDLALAGASFVLDRTRQDEVPEGSMLGAMRATLAALESHKRRRGLSPEWAKAAGLLEEAGSLRPKRMDAIIATRQRGDRLATLLLEAGVPEAALADALARASTAPRIELTTDPVHGSPVLTPEEALAAPTGPVLLEQIAARSLPKSFCEDNGLVLVAAWETEGVVAMVDPTDDGAVWEAQERTGLKLYRYAAVDSQVRHAISRAWMPRADVAEVTIGEPKQALPFATAVGVPLAAAAIVFAFIFRDQFDLRHAFAMAALVCGLFFFSYALRYYITTAAVLAAVLVGDTIRRRAVLSATTRGRAAAVAEASKKAAAHQVYRTLRGERLDEIGKIVTDAQPRIGEHRLPPDRQPFVSVHLATYNEKRVVDRLLGACTSFDYENYEVIVADDSTDETVQILEQWQDHPRVRILHRPTRRGFKGGALQEALRRMDARAEYVMVFDADFIPPPDAIWHFLDYFGRLGANGNGNGNGHHAPGGPGVASGVPANGDQLAAVQGYQWHMLNASENWITKAIRTEFSGSYVLERAAQELFGTMKMISGSVYMIRADVLRRLGWSTSITEDWELTIRLYLAGYKVLYTPYIQAPSECVGKIRQLVRQRMRWARGHTFNVKKYFFAVMRSPHMTWREKFEFLYYAPYYLQSVIFLLGTVSWLVGIFLLQQKLPQWGEVLGWTLVVSNVLALPLMNLAGLVLEGSLKRDALGLLSFIGLSTLLVPFQGWAALRGLLEPDEGGWARTPKSGKVTEAVGAFRLAGLLPWELPGRKKARTRVAAIALTCFAVAIAAGILAVSALSVRAVAATGKGEPSDYLVPAIAGTIIPLAILGVAWFKLKRRLAVAIVCFAIGLSSNVLFLAASVPAAAVVGLTNVFTFARTTTFSSPRLDMIQSYTPGGASTTCPATAGNGWTCEWVSDTFTSAMSMGAGSATVDLYGENNVSTIAFRAAGAFATPACTQVTPGLPTGWQAGDLHILVLQTGDNDPSTVPAGWTSINVANNGTSSRSQLWYRVAQSGDTAPLVQNVGCDSISARIIGFSGVHGTTPLDVTPSFTTSSADDFVEAGAITTVSANTMLVFAAMMADNHTGYEAGFPTPGTWTLGFWSSTTFGFDSAIAAHYQLAATAGTQAALSAQKTGGGAAIVSTGAQIALRPAARTCALTVTLYQDQGGTGATLVSLGSGTANVTSPTAATLVSTTFSTPAVTFADADRLLTRVTAPADSANCNARVSYDGSTQQSKLTTATIVPEGVLGLLLLAPAIPLAIRRLGLFGPGRARRRDEVAG